MNSSKDNNNIELDLELDSTVETLSNRLARKLKEKEVLDNKSQQSKQTRQALLLKSMNVIRKALTETSRIELNERFKLELEIDDWEGWPRAQLKLLDLVCPDKCNLSLFTEANDRNQNGSIRFSLNNTKNLEILEINSQEDFTKLPLLLKKVVRQFLELVTNQVLNPSALNESLEQQTKALNMEHEEEHQTKQSSHTESKLQSEDLFEENINSGNENSVALSNDECRTFIDEVNLYKSSKLENQKKKPTESEKDKNKDDLLDLELNF